MYRNFLKNNKVKFMKKECCFGMSFVCILECISDLLIYGRFLPVNKNNFKGV